VVAGFGGALQLSSFEQPQQEERNSPAADGGCENVKPSTLLVCHDHPRRGGGERLAGALSPRPDRCLCSRASATARVPAWPCVRNASGGGSSPSYAHQHPYSSTSCQVLFTIRGFPSLLRPRASRPAAILATQRVPLASSDSGGRSVAATLRLHRHAMCFRYCSIEPYGLRIWPSLSRS
jgi:hypothetical protein